MAINRYTQPIQHQFMPTQPDARLTAMMLQKKSADRAQAEQQQSMLENELLGTKAYGADDQAKLNEISQAYQNQLSEAYDNYKDDPNALSMALHQIRRSFDKDKLSGDLYNINKNYGLATSTRETADKALMSGDISQSAYNWMMQDPVNRTTANKNTKPLEVFATKIASADYSDDMFSGNATDALNNAMNMFEGLAASELAYMTPEQQEVFRARGRAIFANKYRNIHGVKNDSDGLSSSQTQSKANNKSKQFEFDNKAFDDNGNFKEGYGEDISARNDWNPLTGLSWDVLTTGMDVLRIDKETGRIIGDQEEWSKKIEEVRNLADVYGFDEEKKMTDQQKVDEVNKILRTSNSYHNHVINLSDKDKTKYKFPDINTVNLAGLDLTIDGEKVDKSEVDKLFGKIITNKTGAYVSENAQISTLNGELMYTVREHDGTQHTIGINGYNKELSEKLMPFKRIVEAIDNAKIGKGSLSNIGGSAKIIKDGVLTPINYNQVEIMPFKDYNGEYNYAIYLLDNGERIQSTDGKGGSQDALILLDTFNKKASIDIDKIFKQ